MANVLLGTETARRGDEPMKPRTAFEMEWPKWMVEAATGNQKVFAKPDDVPEGWVTKDEYRAMRLDPFSNSPMQTAVESVALNPKDPYIGKVGEFVQIGNEPPMVIVATTDSMEAEQKVADDRKKLFAEAKALGLTPFKGIKTEDLRAKIAEAKAGK